MLPRVSLHFRLLVEADLSEQITEQEAATLRWLIGCGEEPAVHPEELVPVLYADELRNATDVSTSCMPGGPTASLSRRKFSGTGASAVDCWSLAVRTCMLDDAMYESGFAFLAWVGHHTREDGFIGLAREEGSVVPGWIFAAYGGWTYLIADGQVGPLESAAPDPPAALLRAIGP